MQEGSNWRLRVVSSRKELPLCEGQEEEDEEGDGEGEEGERGEKGEKGEGEEGKKGVVGIAREFYHKEIRDYCLPDRDHVIFRYRDLPACRGLDLAPSVSPSLPPSLPPFSSLPLSPSRYSMKVSQDCPITVQLRTSKKDAYIKLEVDMQVVMQTWMIILCGCCLHDYLYSMACSTYMCPLHHPECQPCKLKITGSNPLTF